MSKMNPVLVAPDAVTATTTFGQVSVEGARKVTLAFTRDDDAGGSSAFTIKGSVDGTTFVSLNLLIDNVTNASSAGLTRVASCTLSTETSKLYALDLESFGLKAIEITVTEVTSGTHSYKALIEY